MNKLALVLDEIKKDLTAAYQSSSSNYKDIMIQRAIGKVDALLILSRKDK